MKPEHQIIEVLGLLTRSDPQKLFKQFQMLTPKDLHNYQVNAAKFIMKTPKCALWCEMGLGKTIITLTALREILRHCPEYRALIIAPKRVCESVWSQESQKWQHTSHMKPINISGAPKIREKKLSSGNIHIIGVDLIKWLVSFYGKSWPYDVIIIDEASCFKDSTSQRFKALKKVTTYAKRVIELTGTPAPNSLINVWSQVFLLDAGARLCKTMTMFKSRYFNSDYMGYSWEIKPGADEEIHSRLTDICLTLSAKDYLEMPRRIDNIIQVPMCNKTRAVYQELKKKLVVELNNDLVVAANIASLVNKLKQLCNGGIYGVEDYQHVHDNKLDYLERIINEAEGTPVLVAYCFKFDKDAILKRFKGRVHEIHEPGIVDRWNRGQVPILIAHPASAGHGLNLQAGSHIMAWFGLTWSLELYQQFNARLHRQGQTKPVIIHHLIVKDSIEQLVMDALDRKDLTQKGLLDAMKRDMYSW